MRRQKRKPDSIQLNFVQSNPKRKSISLKRVSYHFASETSATERVSEASSNIQPTSGTWLSTTRASSSFTPEDLDLGLNESFSPSSKQVDSHTRRKSKAAEAWEERRPNLVPTLIDVSGFPSQATCCLFCKSSSASVWCKDCSASAFLCDECTIRLHSDINIFHNPLSWKDEVKMYLPFPRKVTVSSKCGCDSTYCRDLTCVDEKGCYHSVCVTFCSCEPEVITLMRAQLFPATPKQPLLAFTFALLDLFEALMLECQVSAQDFVAAIGVLTDKLVMKDEKCNLYPVIIDSFEEYRHMKYTHTHLKLLIPDRHNDGTKCPACPKGGQVFYSIDGNFGLCRKRASGSSVRPPLHQQTMFFDQDGVDNYVQTYGTIQMPFNKECNQFLAGDAVRSSSRYKALDETGVVGVVCRHEFPFKLYSLRHGERLSYIVYALERILEHSQDHGEVRILYDVACTLQRHLQKQGRTDLLGYFQLAIPVFHSYGHKVDCQFKYSPRNLDGFGLTDGEVVERLWSYLRRFCKMTKEMRPSHRIDILTDAVLHYCQQSQKRLGHLLPSRMRKAMKIQQDAKHELEELMHNSPVQFSPTDIQQWYKEELHPSSQSSEPQDQDESWEQHYFSVLKIYYSLLDEIRLCTTSHLQAISQRLNRVDAELKLIEDKQHIRRWLKDSDVFQDWEKMEVGKERNRIAANIETCAREQWFLLMLKAKFADGQCIASRLSKRLNQETAKLKQYIKLFNSLPGERQITWTDATNLSSPIVCSHTDLAVPRNIRLSAIKHHHLALRTDEEISLLKLEMHSTFCFFLEDWKFLLSAIDELKTKHCSRYNNGALNHLQVARFKCESLLLNLRSAFNTFIDLPLLPVDDFLFKSANLHVNLSITTKPLLEEFDKNCDDDDEASSTADEHVVGFLSFANTFITDDEDSGSSDEDYEHSGSFNEEPLRDLDPSTCNITMLQSSKLQKKCNSQAQQHAQQSHRSTSSTVTLSTRNMSDSGLSGVPLTDLCVAHPLASTTSEQPTHNPPFETQPSTRHPKKYSHDRPISPAMSFTHALSSSDESDGDNFFPTQEEVRRRCLKFEREEFLKQQHH